MYPYSLMVPPPLKSNAGDQKVCKKKNLSWLFGVNTKLCPFESLFGNSWQSRVIPNSEPWTDFSIHTSHPGKILINKNNTLK